MRRTRDFTGTWYSVLLTIVALACLWRNGGGHDRGTHQTQSLQKVLRVTPTWETTSVVPRPHRRTLWSLVEKSERTIILRIWYGPESYYSDYASRILEEDSPQDDEVFSVAISFEDIYKTIIFMAATWLLGSLGELIGMPSLVGEIIAGFLLGPPLADIVPFPEAMVLIGNIGLIGMILESGIDIDVGQLKETGLRAVFMAFTGTTLPLLTGLGLGRAAGQDWRSSIAIGASFAPSSLGVAGNALSAGEVLNTPIGQMIVAASVVDDVLGLILLSILEVFVKDDPQVFDFVLPFISSFGYLIVLGYSGVTWMPRLIEHKIMPMFRVEHREFVAFGLMFVILLAYMPLLNYSKASYLTGTFLAGLTFSQINSVHASFVNKGRQLLNWMMRLLFAATIGFQVPIKKFHDLYVLRWGASFILPILAKLPLFLFVPRFQKGLPDDFPYDPYKRDALITSLAMTCRGEFNFIIAAFALGEGLFDAYLYSAVVLAVLLSSITSPLLLLKLARHYNEKSKSFVNGNHPVQRIENTCDGYRPLYLGIQARTPIHWGLQNTFKKALESNGLIIIDHRSWHTLGHDAVDITELFVQDTVVKVRVRACFGGDPESLVGTTVGGDGEKVLTGVPLVVDPVDLDKVLREQEKEVQTSDDSSTNSAANEEQEIEDRCNEIRTVLMGCLLSDDAEDYNIQVTQWTPYTVFGSKTSSGPGRVEYCLQSHVSNNDYVEEDLAGDSHDDTPTPPPPPPSSPPPQGFGAIRRPSRVRRYTSASSRPSDQEDNTVHHDPHLAADLWDADAVAQDVARHGFIMAPVGHGHDVVEGTERRGSGIMGSPRRRASTYDSAFSAVVADEETFAPDTIKERLHGYVRD